MTNAIPFVRRVQQTLSAHRIPNGRLYARKLRNFTTTKEALTDVYGTADAAIILYTLNDMPNEQAERSTWIEALRRFQHPETGAFAGIGHHEIHSTAFAVSALELFDAKPTYPLNFLRSLLDKEALFSFLDSLDWLRNPWVESQKGAGIYACYVLSGMADQQWEDWYFEWLWDNADPVTGLWRKGCVRHIDGSLMESPLFHHVAGSFHYLFNLDYRKKKLRYPKQIINTCLELVQSGTLKPSVDSFTYFEIDWVYTLQSCMAQTDYRREEILSAIRVTTAPFLRYVERLGNEDPTPFEDLHSLCGAVCGLAAIQGCFPELVRTDKSLQSVLARRPFI